MHSFGLATDSDTRILGRQIAGRVKKGDVIALSGDLGAGKTTFARGLIQALVGETDVPSPTYTLIQIYDAPNFKIWHCDFYRLKSPEEVLELGLLEAMEKTVCLIEWADHIGEYLPTDHKTVHIRFDGDGRIADVTGYD